MTAYAQPQPSPQAPPYPYAQPQYQAPRYPYGQPPQNPYGQPQYGRMDRRLTVLHQRLGITPAQEAAWTAFASEMRNAAMPTDRTRETPPAKCSSVLSAASKRSKRAAPNWTGWLGS